MRRILASKCRRSAAVRGAGRDASPPSARRCPGGALQLRSLSLDSMSQPTNSLPVDAQGVLELAAQSMFDTLAASAMGMMVVDRSHRIVWISQGYKQFLPGLEREETDFVGRRVEDVVPNTLMAQVIDSGRPILIDLLSNKAGTFLVSRLPLREREGAVIGAVGIVLLDHPETAMQPLFNKFAGLEHELADARSQLAAHLTQQRRAKHTLASSVGTSAEAIEV
jgi:transcriptional regulator with PAS, ATPase and Fis domain